VWSSTFTSVSASKVALANGSARASACTTGPAVAAWRTPGAPGPAGRSPAPACGGQHQVTAATADVEQAAGRGQALHPREDGGQHDPSRASDLPGREAALIALLVLALDFGAAGRTATRARHTACTHDSAGRCRAAARAPAHHRRPRRRPAPNRPADGARPRRRALARPRPPRAPSRSATRPGGDRPRAGPGGRGVTGEPVEERREVGLHRLGGGVAEHERGVQRLE
jgi:hypothetical protein